MKPLASAVHSFALLGAAVLVTVFGGVPANAFVTFESGQVRPLAVSPDGSRLFATNTPDNMLEIFDINVGSLTHVGSVPVGLEPVAVAARSNAEVWVVNHLSDSVSVVDVSNPSSARVIRTLLVGDEPRDIVFAGPGGNRAFVTTAHRGQNTPLQADIETVLTTPGIGRADVWVFDANNLGTSLGGDQLSILTLFSDTPRALAVSPDGSTVYAAAFESGNRTTTLSEGIVPDGGVANGGLPNPRTDHLGVAQPEVGLIVKFNGSQWLDELGRDWSSVVRFSLPDKDVFAIDANANPPVQLTGPSAEFAHVGTVLFNMAVNPVSGKVYVSNTEAFNEVRFEGEGIFTGQPTVRGHLAESRITVLGAGGSVTPIHLNKHIDYGSCCDAIPNATNDKSLAFPLQMAVTSDGATLYVAAFGSGKIGVFDTAQLESNTFTPNAADQIELTGGGPTGLVLDESRSQLYVMTRFDNSVSVVSTGTGMEAAHVPLYNPEPASVVNGRRFLYDARATSSHGDQACASCHIFGDFDSLAWDLGNPDDTTIHNPGPIIAPFDLPGFGTPDFRALKGPMTTQSLRGMDNHGPMHWRGDRTGGNDSPPNVQPNGGAFSEDAAFKKFNPAFVGLVGRSDQLTADEMQSFTDFILQVMYPPNPIRNLDNSDTPDQAAARTRYFGPNSDTVHNCNGCHLLSPNGNAGFGVPRPGFFGTEGRYSFENETQFMKVAQLRNIYQKIGMFGMPAVPFLNAGNNGFMGDQVRGFGFLHDGSIDTVLRFFRATVFNFNASSNPGGFSTDAERRQMEAFAHAFPTNHAPIVGQQATRTSTSGGAVDARIDLMLARADANPKECDVIAKGTIAGVSRGAVYTGSGGWVTDRASDGTVPDAGLRAIANTAGQELTFTAVPKGEGVRMGIDQDLDGAGDADEVAGGSDPRNELSLPCVSPAAFSDKDRASIKDSRGQVSLKASMNLGTYGGENLELRIQDGGGAILDTGLIGSTLVLNKSGSTYSYKSKLPGLQRVTIKADPKVAGVFKIKVKARDAWTPGAANETEATTTVSLSIGDQCLSGNATSVN